jgi:hypothetical protein
MQGTVDVAVLQAGAVKTLSQAIHVPRVVVTPGKKRLLPAFHEAAPTHLDGGQPEQKRK